MNCSCSRFGFYINFQCSVVLLFGIHFLYLHEFQSNFSSAPPACSDPQKLDRLGSESLTRSRNNAKYSFEYKLRIVKSYLTSEISYQELALKEGISNSSLIVRWVNDFRIAGPAALRPKKKGRKESLKKKKESCPVAVNNVDAADDKERIRQLEEELLKLRIENAYLKELRRLRLEEETLQRKRRE